MEPGEQFLADAAREFRKYRSLAEQALAQAPKDRWTRRLDPGSNSLATLVRHMSGNLRSRWSNFLTTDGEKPDRQRDLEFEDAASDDPATLRARWDAAWDGLFDTIDSLRPADLDRTVTIRGEPHTVMQAMQRQLTHYAYHVGQIVFVAKHFAGAEWHSLSIPRGRSKDFEVAKDGSPYRA